MPRAVASTGSPPAAGRSALPGRWIVGPGYDQLFLLAAWCVPLLLWAIAVSFPYGLLAALAIFVLLDNSHQVASLPLTIFDPATMRTSAAGYLGGAAAIGATAVALSFYPESLASKIWASLVIYWGAWHIIRQHYGFLRLYQARDKPSSPREGRAEVVALYAGSAFPYFLNLAHGWAADDIGKMLYRVPVPSWSPSVVLAIFGAAFAMVLADAAGRLARRETVLTPRLVHLVLVVSNFWIGLLGVGRENLILAVLFITSYHDLQYHAVVWFVGRKRVAPAEAPVYPAVRRMFASMGVFVAAVLAGAVLQALLRNDFQVVSSVVPTSATTAALFALVNSYAYMHYFFDGRMWKLSRDARLRAELGLGGASPATAVAPHAATKARRRSGR